MTVSRPLEILLALNESPTATFHEAPIYGIIHRLMADTLARETVSWRYDAFGNLLLTYRPVGESKGEVTLVAHTDHPAFDVAAVEGRKLTLRILGGVPLEELRGCKVRLANHPEATATVESADKEKKQALATFEDDPPAGIVGAPVVHDLPAAEIRDGLIHAPVIDDFVGCAMALAAFEDSVNQNVATTVSALLTRAEEIGFIGAQAAIEERTVNEDAVVISLEASSVMPGIVSGEGPCIREGDRGFLFDANVTAGLAMAADKLRAEGLPVQQARMTGGVCEGSLFHAHGFTAGGMAIPLLNYHNKGDGRIEREAVATQDVETGARLLVEFARLLPETGIRSRSALRHAIASRFLAAKKQLQASGKALGAAFAGGRE